MPARTPSSSPNPFLSLLARVKKRLDPRLAQILAESEARALKQGTEVAIMVKAVRLLCERGGKRLRPGLCALGALSENSRNSLTVAIEAGVSLELLQAYFLIHDDWMDKDDERRGGPTAHIALASEFGTQELGDASAILAGDHAIALASAQLATLPTSPNRLKKCLVHFAEMQISAVAGQQLDIVGRAPDPELTYALKTASYTVRGPLLLGAELAGASQITKRTLSDFSLPAGIAFQLRDDLLGVFGAPAVTGKPQGSDLQEGKNTTLIREAKKRLSERDLPRLTRVLGNRQATRREVKTAIAALERCGARAAVEARIETLSSQAMTIVTESRIKGKSQELLQGAVRSLAYRSV